MTVTFLGSSPPAENTPIPTEQPIWTRTSAWALITTKKRIRSLSLSKARCPKCVLALRVTSTIPFCCSLTAVVTSKRSSSLPRAPSNTTCSPQKTASFGSVTTSTLLESPTVLKRTAKNLKSRSLAVPHWITMHTCTSTDLVSRISACALASPTQKQCSVTWSTPVALRSPLRVSTHSRTTSKQCLQPYRRTTLCLTPHATPVDSPF